jgi:glutamate-ammonia-ligase adenylyltransferase
LAETQPPEESWLNALRRWRRREILRIGTRDICLHAPLEEITRDLSVLADALVGSVLRRFWQRAFAAGQVPLPPGEGFAVFALGKLGGAELNYSSDIDLLAVCADEVRERVNDYIRLLEQVGQALSQHLAEGYAYRVDFRLRPYGGEGLLVQPFSGVARYYSEQAELPEIQALLKLRWIAGDEKLGARVAAEARSLLLQPHARETVVASVDKMRQAALRQLDAEPEGVVDLKNGLGGLRDIEFMAQGLQLIHAAAHPELLSGHTLTALRALGQAGILTEPQLAELSDDYIFLRRVEHFLQLLEDRQIHALPSLPRELAALGKRMLGVQTSAEVFTEEVRRRLKRVRDAYINGFLTQ